MQGETRRAFGAYCGGLSVVGALSVVMGFALLFAPPAGAHASLDHAAPRVGSTVQAPPSSITLWFSEQLEPAFSTIEVLDQAGHRMDQGAAHLDDKDARALRVALKPLPSGAYDVVWRVVSADTHATQGKFTFRVAG